MIFNLFKSSSKLGIDIGASSVKIVELAKSGGRFVLKNYGFSELKSPSGNPLGNDPLRLPDEALTWTIKEILAKSNMRTKDAVASIPSFSTFATVIEMPYLSEDDLAKAIPFEARKYVPIPLQEVILDWSIIGIVDNPSGPNVSTTMGTRAATVEVFLAAVPKDETARYQRVMKAAGLNLVALELENSGLIRALLGNDLSPTAIINIGGRSTSIVIVAKGYERLSHNYEIGGFEITKAIARSLNVSFEKAEDLKRKLGLAESNENIVRESIVSLIDMMIFEAKKTITSYEESKNKKIGRIVLVGSLINMPHFVGYFKERIGIDTYVGNVFSRIQYPHQLEPLAQELSNNFSIAVGLAMREI